MGRKALDEFERNLILETLQKHDGRQRETANEMGIHRATLWRKMKKMKIDSVVKSRLTGENRCPVFS